MEFLYITIPITLLIALGSLAAFLWSAKSGQLNDLEGPKYRMLFEDKDDLPKES
ncbi:cbb3-type cytochrome oxidase assembly protein CcoS [Leptospira sp. GIMC2001]|uniref:cbb3-type cytochrome oxidase assembly protein CcoS n=1 Tax=Leptospira sp. GIMC2001 TaxID=1513297 RepID=UPI00234A83B6|nr:cbb3-type cytochrome oxidase assembly protein CcoS [Leptospira sp. GIMC2001]WCL50504.1 cbb3-type cytochrome oxidase assembly protein CcoS [Leptospira sp. GIMC2001]